MSFKHAQKFAKNKIRKLSCNLKPRPKSILPNTLRRVYFMAIFKCPLELVHSAP